MIKYKLKDEVIVRVDAKNERVQLTIPGIDRISLNIDHGVACSWVTALYLDVIKESVDWSKALHEMQKDNAIYSYGEEIDYCVRAGVLLESGKRSSVFLTHEWRPCDMSYNELAEMEWYRVQ